MVRDDVMSDYRIAANKHVMHQAGLLITLVRVIHRYGDNKLIARYAVTAIGNFSSDGMNMNVAYDTVDTTRKAVVDSGGIEAIVILMGKQSNDAGVQEHGCRTMYNIALSADADMVSKMVTCGVEEAVMSSSKQFGTHLQLQEMCIHILDILSGQKTKEQVQTEHEAQLAASSAAFDLTKPKPKSAPPVDDATVGISATPDVWTVDDVCKWLTNIQLDECIDVFKSKNIGMYIMYMS